MTEVWQRLNCGGSRLLTALALADFANDSGDRIYPSIECLAEKTRQVPRVVQRHIAFFKKVGWLEQLSSGKGGRSLSTRYRISPAWIKGDILSPFPDVKRVTSESKRVTVEVKTLTPRSPDPPRSTNNHKKRARVSPKDSRAEDEIRKRRIRAKIHDLRLTTTARDTRLIATLTDTTPEEVQRELESLSGAPPTNGHAGSMAPAFLRTPPGTEG